MNNSISSRIINATIFVVFGLMQASAQGEKSKAPPMHRAHIVNGTVNDIGFRVRIPGEAWQVDRLAPGEGVTYECPKCKDMDFEIDTAGNVVTRTLEMGQDYKIYWNDSAQHYDVGTP
ncbi:hypothetical protein [Paraburkholderia pallida]|uniref:Uncharacterized protein n=1 Tax=Paraburkholderia pallida TaxID=2547399 RepID=A0A4P7D8W0_9BURK|nr:hypothetical protein [Paraburkholderia pallida]QBR03630.1 hypothetical protein E1956_41720 [Paraburkholderia pallida]